MDPLTCSPRINLGDSHLASGVSWAAFTVTAVDRSCTGFESAHFTWTWRLIRATAPQRLFADALTARGAFTRQPH